MHDKDSLICDLAEYYHIYDLKALPVDTLAGLCCGLRADSRTMMNLSGQKLPINTLLLAGILDALNFGNWMNSQYGQKGINKPKSILSELTKEKSDIQNFETGASFADAWNSLIGEQ